MSNELLRSIVELSVGLSIKAENLCKRMELSLELTPHHLMVQTVPAIIFRDILNGAHDVDLQDDVNELQIKKALTLVVLTS